MNLRFLKLVSLLSVNIVLLLFSFTLWAGTKVLYGSSAVVLPVNVQEFVYSGFYLALHERFSENEIKDFLIQDQRSGKSSMEAFEIVQDHLKDNLNAIFGFPSTYESQLITNLVNKSGILTFFASSTNTNLRNIGPKIFSTSDDPKLTVYAFIDLMKSRYANKKGIILYFPEDYFSLNQKLLWDEVFSEIADFRLDAHPIDKTGQNENLINLIKKYDYIVVTSFPTVAFDLLTFLQNNKVDLPTFTNSSWYKVNNEILSRIFSDKKSEVYMVDIWNRTSLSSLSFFSKYEKTYHSKPGIEAAIGYDLGIILAELIHRSEVHNVQDLTEAFLMDPCFIGSPLGDVCFKKDGGFGMRKLNLIKYSNGNKIVIGTIDK